MSLLKIEQGGCSPMTEHKVVTAESLKILLRSHLNKLNRNGLQFVAGNIEIALRELE
jgi:hypothetical protein